MKNENQKRFDAEINRVHNLADLEKHAIVGRMCKCGDCFTCAAEAARAKFVATSAELAERLGKHETISLESANKLGKILDASPRVVLELLVRHAVKFAAPLAARRLKVLKEFPEAHNYNEVMNVKFPHSANPVNPQGDGQ
jgi:hypothetical protein